MPLHFSVGGSGVGSASLTGRACALLTCGLFQKCVECLWAKKRAVCAVVKSIQLIIARASLTGFGLRVESFSRSSVTVNTVPCPCTSGLGV